MGRTQRLAIVTLFLVVYVGLTAAQQKVTLSPDDMQCFFPSLPPSTCTSLRSCRTCLNADLASASCFLDSRGLCLSMSSYNPARRDGIRQFAAANSTYCLATDTTCKRCLLSGTASGVCRGEAGCVCLAACESETWQEDVKSIVVVASSAEASPSVANVMDTSKTSLAVVMILVLAGLVGVMLLVNTIRRRWIKKQALAPSGFAYKLALTPTATLPPKPLV